jgi:hypothetical protein
MTDALSDRRDAGRRLDRSYGTAYVIFSGDGTYSATRLHNGQALVASSPEELRGKIEADLAARPVPAWALAELP